MASKDQIRIALQECMNDFEVFAEHCLKVKAKSGKIEPFILNDTQRYIHRRLEEQRAKTGRVRALILKSRQMGCSTYIGGRYLWRIRFSQGLRCFILTHAASATDNLFNMVKRYLDKFPAQLKPEVGDDSAKSLTFPKLDGSYHVGTAGFKDTGVSETFQLFHASEAALWSNPEAIARGALQAVPDEEGTEVIGESTSRGSSGWYYQQCQAAIRGESEYQFIFCPWFWQREYRKEPPQGFTLSQKEAAIAKTYDLDMQQMAFRRAKIIELSANGADGEALFNMEYPACPEDAFSAGDDKSLIPVLTVRRAMKSTLKQGYGKIIMGVDPAREGDDRTAICVRQGRFIRELLTYSKIETTQLTGIVTRLIKKHKPDLVNIDAGTFGIAIVDMLRERGYNKVRGVNFGGKADERDRYYNKRAEMWARMKLWLDDEPVMLPNRDDILQDLTGVQYSFDSHGRLKLERKEDMKKRGLRSPDIGDSAALTFAEIVFDDDIDDDYTGYVPADARVGI